MRPPRRAERWLLSAIRSPHLRRMARQDLRCEYADRRHRGAARALLWYWCTALGLALRLRLCSPRASRRPDSPGRAPEPRREGPLPKIYYELRLAVRALARAPGYTLAAALTLAIGIGANAAIFSVVDGVLLRPLPFADPDRLVLFEGVRHGEPMFGGSMTYPDLVDWRGSTAFADVAIFHRSAEPLIGYGEPRLLESVRATANYFEVLGLRPELGRFFLPVENELGHPDVVVLSHRLWSTVFGADPAIVGSAITLDGDPHLVIGVAPAGFEDPAGNAPQLWTVRPPYFTAELSTRSAYRFRAVGRLAEGATLEAAQADVERISERIEAELPEGKTGFSARLVPVEEVIVGPVRTSLLVLFGAVGLLLLIVGANVANLTLSRASARRRQLAVRAALGAGRGRLAWQLLTEGAVLGSLGGGLGLAIGFAFTSLLLRLSDGSIPRWERVSLDGRVLAFTVAVSLVSVVLFSLLPALSSASSSPAQALSQGRRIAGDRGRSRTRGLLVVAETALAVVLLIWGGLLARSLAAVLSVDSGFDTDRLLAVRLSPTAYEDEPGRLLELYATLEDRFAALPGVTAAGAINNLPLAKDGSMCFGYQVEERPPPAAGEWRCAQARTISAGYLEASGMRLVHGRALAVSDRPGRPPAILINQALARLEFPGEDPVGRRLTLQRTSQEIIGVVQDVRQFGLMTDAEPAVYSHMPQEPAEWAYGSVTFVLRTEGEPGLLAAAARAAVWEIDDTVVLPYTRTMDSILFSDTAGPRFRAVLLAAFALSALALTAIGTAAVLALSVAQRRHEIGVRMAFGARRSSILEMVVGQGLRLTVAGVALGTGVALVSTRIVRSLVFGISPVDPLVFVATPVLLLVIAVTGCLVPAWRAARLDPVRTLRAE